MALDPRYIVSVDIEEYFVNKDSGMPLSGGTIAFFKDNDRAVHKPVFELSGAPPNYTYTELPNPLTLSSVGTPQDDNGNNVAIYYYPYDDNGNIELYYIEVRNSLGVLQLTREGWPNASAINDPNDPQGSLTNQISNPQFVDVSFLPTNPLVITIAGAGATTVSIAPMWDLVINSAGAGSVTVARTAVSGVAALPNNPPYTLTVTPGLNINSLFLRQRLENNPAIFSRAVGGQNGFIAASILLAPLSSTTISYQPNGRPAEVILNANNISGNYLEISNTIQLDPAANPSTADTGYVDIILTLPTGSPTTLSNVQIIGLNSNIQGLVYEQITANRQKDLLFNYYNPLLQYKPIPSYLIGWDFALNPTQPLGSTIAATAIGANASKYTWDQTIIFQGTNTGPAITRHTSGALRVTANNATQFALIQYLPASIARQLLNNPLSVNVAALTPQVGGLAGNISLWYTDNVNLPDIGANTSIVTTLTASGKPNAVAAGWNEVTRNGLGNANFTVANSATTNFNDYGFSGWDLNGIAAVNTTTWFAIVVGFAQLQVIQTIDFHSISLVPGYIPTRPAPQSQAGVLVDCQQFYEMSFNIDVVPAQNIGTGSGVLSFGLPWPQRPPVPGPAHYVYYKTSKYKVPTTITTFNPAANNNAIRNLTVNEDMVATASSLSSKNGFLLSCEYSDNTNAGDQMAVYWTSDSRLGF